MREKKNIGFEWLTSPLGKSTQWHLNTRGLNILTARGKLSTPISLDQRSFTQFSKVNDPWTSSREKAFFNDPKLVNLYIPETRGLFPTPSFFFFFFLYTTVFMPVFLVFCPEHQNINSKTEQCTTIVFCVGITSCTSVEFYYIYMIMHSMQSIWMMF